MIKKISVTVILFLVVIWIANDGQVKYKQWKSDGPVYITGVDTGYIDSVQWHDTRFNQLVTFWTKDSVGLVVDYGAWLRQNLKVQGKTYGQGGATSDGITYIELLTAEEFRGSGTPINDTYKGRSYIIHAGGYSYFTNNMTFLPILDDMDALPDTGYYNGWFYPDWTHTYGGVGIQMTGGTNGYLSPNEDKMGFLFMSSYGPPPPSTQYRDEWAPVNISTGRNYPGMVIRTKKGGAGGLLPNKALDVQGSAWITDTLWVNGGINLVIPSATKDTTQTHGADTVVLYGTDTFRVAADTFRSGNDPWKAFDGSGLTSWATGNDADTLSKAFPHQLVYRFPDSVEVIQISIETYEGYINSFRFLGSKDSVTFDTLLSRIHRVGAGGHPQTSSPVPYTLTNSGNYIYYTLECLDNWAGHNTAKIEELEMYTKLVSDTAFMKFNQADSSILLIISGINGVDTLVLADTVNQIINIEHLKTDTISPDLTDGNDTVFIEGNVYSLATGTLFDTDSLESTVFNVTKATAGSLYTVLLGADTMFAINRDTILVGDPMRGTLFSLDTIGAANNDTIQVVSKTRIDSLFTNLFIADTARINRNLYLNDTLITDLYLRQDAYDDSLDAHGRDMIDSSISAYKDSLMPSGFSTDSLVAYYSFDDSATKDYSGLGNDGVNYGVVHKTEYDSIIVGTGATKFNYTAGVESSYVDITSVLNDVANTQQGTWIAWVKPVNATPSITQKIITFGDANVNEALILDIRLTTGVIRLINVDYSPLQTNYFLETNAQGLQDGVWGNIVVTHNGIEPIIYINGIKVTQSFTIDSDRTSWFSDLNGLDNGRIGSINYNNSGEANFFNGIIDEVIIDKRAWTQSEIQNYYYNSTHFNELMTKQDKFPAKTYVDSMVAITDTIQVVSPMRADSLYAKYLQIDSTLFISVISGDVVNDIYGVKVDVKFVGDGMTRDIYGGYFKADQSVHDDIRHIYGVYGYAGAGVGLEHANYGLYGFADALAETSYAIYGLSNSSSERYDWAGYFDGFTGFDTTIFFGQHGKSGEMIVTGSDTALSFARGTTSDFYKITGGTKDIWLNPYNDGIPDSAGIDSHRVSFSPLSKDHNGDGSFRKFGLQATTSAATIHNFYNWTVVEIPEDFKCFNPDTAVYFMWNANSETGDSITCKVFSSNMSGTVADSTAEILFGGTVDSWQTKRITGTQLEDLAFQYGDRMLIRWKFHVSGGHIVEQGKIRLRYNRK